MPRSSSLPFINAQSHPACAARNQIVPSDIEPLRAIPSGFGGPSVPPRCRRWAPDRRRNEYASGPIGSRRSLKLHVV